MVKTNRKVPYVEQLQQTECGLCCVAMILRYYKSYESLSTLRNLMESGRDGLRLNELKELLDNLGFSSKAYKTTVEGLLMIDSPCILHWNDNHFVILEKTNKKYFYIVDPAVGRKRVSYDEMAVSFTGIVLIPLPNKNFKPQVNKENPFKILIPIIKLNKNMFAFIFLLSLFAYIATLFIPISIQILTDSIVQNKVFHNSYFWLFSTTLAVYSFVLYIRGKYLVKIKAVIEKDLRSNVFQHLLEVPYKFFEVRAKGDILYRMNSIDVIKDLLTDRIIKGILDFGALLFIFGYMLSQSMVLASVVLCLFFIYLSCTFLLRNYLKELNLYEVVERSKLQKSEVEAISSIFGIKVASSEGEILYQWKNKMDDVLKRFIKQGEVGNLYNTFSQVCILVSPIIVLFFAMNQYLGNQFTIGQTISFYTISTMFFSYASSFFQTWNYFWIASNSIERLKDITQTPKEDMGIDKTEPMLSGDIRLENVSFSYTTKSNLILKDLTFHIKSGQKIAIVGQSGSGKSTLAKLLIGLYEPTEGMIYYDNEPITSINKKKLRREMAIVPQEIQLLNKSIFDNIVMGNMNASFEKVTKAAEIAQISETIEEMPMQYSTLISDMGSNLSGGQRQRIALARSILNKHKVVILDEATSSLDSLNELKIADYFTNIGCTCIIIAHRLSTIIDSDMILVLEDGKIVESGNHQELLDKKGKYYSLYSTKFEKSNTIVNVI